MAEKQKKLTDEEIKEAKEKKWCPFCHKKRFSGTMPEAWQNFSIDKDGRVELDSVVAGEYDCVECLSCEQEIPSEIWSKWF